MRRTTQVFALLCALLLTAVAGAQTQPRTWRLDFYETGGPGIEAFSFDRLVIEPLAWPDNVAANVDTRLTGNYRFEIVSAGKVILRSRRRLSGLGVAWTAMASTGRRMAHAAKPGQAANASKLHHGSEGTTRKVCRMEVSGGW